MGPHGSKNVKREKDMARATVRGVYRKGRIKLLEPPPEDSEGPVLVVFLDKIDGVDEKQPWLKTARKRPLKGCSLRDATFDVRSTFDRVAHLIGCVRGGPPGLSERTGRRFSDHLRQAKANRR